MTQIKLWKDDLLAKTYKVDADNEVDLVVGTIRHDFRGALFVAMTNRATQRIGLTNEEFGPYIQVEDAKIQTIWFAEKRIFQGLNLSIKRMEAGFSHYWDELIAVDFFNGGNPGINLELVKFQKELASKRANNENNKLEQTKERKKMKDLLFQTRIDINGNPGYVVEGPTEEEFKAQLGTILDGTIKSARKGKEDVKITMEGVSLSIRSSEKKMAIEKDDKTTATPNWKQSTAKTIAQFSKNAFGDKYPQVSVKVEKPEKVEKPDEKETKEQLEEFDPLEGAIEEAKESLGEEVDDFEIDKKDIAETNGDATDKDFEIEKEDEETLVPGELGLIDKYNEICPKAGLPVQNLVRKFEQRFASSIKGAEVKSCYIKVDIKLLDGKRFKIYLHSVKKGSNNLRICQKALDILKDSDVITDQRPSGSNIFYYVEPKSHDAWLDLMAEHIMVGSDERDAKVRKVWEKAIVALRKDVGEEEIPQSEMAKLVEIDESTIWFYNQKYDLFGSEIDVYAFINLYVGGTLSYGTRMAKSGQPSTVIVPIDIAEIDKAISEKETGDNVSHYKVLKEFFVELFDEDNSFVRANMS